MNGIAQLKEIFATPRMPKPQPKRATKPTWIERTKVDGRWVSTPHYGTAIQATPPKPRPTLPPDPKVGVSKRNQGRRPLGRMASR